MSAVTVGVLLAAADRGGLSFTGGWFFLDGVDLPEPDGQRARELVFAGLLAKNGSQVETTGEGRRMLAGTR